MQVTGLVLTLEPHALDQLLATLRQTQAVTVGELFVNRLSLVVEASSPQESQRRHEWFAHLPGVLHVDVAFVSFEHEEASPPSRQSGHPKEAAHVS